VTTKVAGGTTDIATPAGSGVTSLAIHDSKGGSYQTDGFATVDATLSGATAGQLSIDDATDATVSLGSGNYNVRVSGLINTATIAMTGGSGTDRMTFIGTANATFVAGAGSTLIVGGAGDNSITFGTGTSRVWGGSGADTYVFHAGDGLQVIETFDAGKGDVLDIARSLESSLHEKVTGGSTLLTFGSNAHGILLQGVSNLDASAIHWI
jgi:Ca2+-binding RTX toxin-like protein